MRRNVHQVVRVVQQPRTTLSASLGFTRVVSAPELSAADLAETIEALEDVLRHVAMSERMRSILNANLSQARAMRLARAGCGVAVPVTRSGAGTDALRAAPHGNHGDNLSAVLR